MVLNIYQNTSLLTSSINQSMDSTITKQIQADLSPVIRIYTDGTVDRLIGSPNVPPTPNHPITGVSSKDITTPPCRIYLPKLTTTNQKLPILIYFHGGGFCIESAFSFLDHNYMNTLCSNSNALIISVEYRLAPEHPLPAAYDDSWTALSWVCSHFQNPQPNFEVDPWITNHGDSDRIFIGGDSAGGNIAHNIAMRAGSEALPGGLRISGAILSHPYFWGSDPVGEEPKEDMEKHLYYQTWVSAAYPNCVGGIDNPLINPIANGAPSLSGLGCEKMLICLAEKDVLTGRGLAYVEKLKKSGWRGVVDVVVVEAEDHCFHVFDLETEKAKDLIKRMASFISE